MRRAGIADGRLLLGLQTFTQRQYQARFANSGLTENKGDLPVALFRLPPAREHELELLAPADERC